VFYALFIFSFVSAQPIQITATREDDFSSLSAPLEKTSSGKASSEDSLFEIPNVNVAGGTNRSRYLQIRGLGETSVYETTPSHSVGFWIEDIDVTGLLAAWPQQNLQSLQVHTGPQSMAYGGFNSAGTLSATLKTAETAELQALSSSANEFQVGLQTRPLKRSDVFLAYRKSDGFYDNAFTDQPGAAQNEVSSSWKQVWKSSEKTQIHSAHLLQNNQNRYDVWSLNNSYVTQSDRQGGDELFLHGHSLKIKHAFNGDISISSLSSFTQASSLYSYDADWAHSPDYDYFDSQNRTRRQWHQKLFVDMPWVSLGTHVYGIDENSRAQNYKKGLLKNSLVSDFQSLNTAFVVQKQWMFSVNELRAEARHEWQNLKYTDSNALSQKKSPQAQAYSLQYVRPLKENLTGSLRWARGFKNPGFNVDPDLSSADLYYGLESTQAYELGVFSNSQKWTVFYQKQNNSQLKISQQSDPQDPSTFFYRTTNIGKTDGWGMEYSGRWNFSRWDFESQVGLLQTQFRDYNFEGKTYRGRALAHAPRWNYATSLSYKWSSRWSSVASYVGRDAFYYSNNHDQQSSAVSLLHLGLLFREKNWDVAFWIKNVADARSTVRGFYFANEPPDWAVKLYEQLGPPRYFLVSSTYRF
jgi:iron complex outermembrane recepter protein